MGIERNGENTQKNKRTSLFRMFKIILIFSIVLFVIAAGAGIGFITASYKTAPSLKNEIRPAASSQIFDINGTLITTIHSEENRLPVSIGKIPKDLQNAFVATEDIRFYQHSGIDLRGIARAMWVNLSQRGVSEGASTITQQLARNALLSQEQTLKRKVHEALLALQIEKKYSKTEILEMYLNQIYFGQGAYGVQAAATVYFGKNVEDLTLAECALIAGIPKSPNYYSPRSNMKAAKERQGVVLEQMVKYGFLDAPVASKARQEEIKIFSRTSEHIADYFVDYVIQTLIDRLGANAVYKDGLKIYTTLDLGMQVVAERVMEQLPVSRTENKIRQPQGALVAIEPQTGHIKAMVGGRGDDQFNRAVLAERQPGSAFKPFVYLTALESGLTPATMIEDNQVSYNGWTPRNYDGTFRNKPVSLRTALELSLNSIAVKLAKQIGVDKTLYYAQQMGISTLVMTGYSNDRTLAMSLGGLTRGVTPLDIASAYGVLANRGIRVEPTAIVKVVARDGRVIEEFVPKGKVVVNERSAYLLTDMLKGVITRGTGTGANIGRPAAGKTGTTSDYKDAWFVGFTPDLATAVWMGHDNNYSLNGVTGSTIPATIWRSFMQEVSQKYTARDFTKPQGIVTARVSNTDGLLVGSANIANNADAPDSHVEIFMEGTQPSKFSTQALAKPEDDDSDKNDKDDKDNKNNPKEKKDIKDVADKLVPGSSAKDKAPPPPPPKTTRPKDDSAETKPAEPPTAPAPPAPTTPTPPAANSPAPAPPAPVPPPKQ